MTEDVIYNSAYDRIIGSVTSGTGTAYPFGAPEFALGFWWGSCTRFLGF